MPARLIRFLVSIGAVLGAHSLYVWLLVPWIEPPIHRGAAAVETGPVQTPTQKHPELAEFFPAGSWERDNPKLLKTEQGMLLFQDYRPLNESQLELRPCSLVFFGPQKETPQGAESRRYVVLRATQRAVLEFDGTVDLTRAQLGKLRGGRLEGPVTISSPASRPDRDDAVQLVTRNVQIEEGRIWTPHEVQFRFGKHHGGGRELSVLLGQSADPQPPEEAAAVTGIESVELATVDKISLMLPGKGLLSETSRDQDTPRADGAEPPPLPIEITCRGPFKFDVTGQQATFEDQVDVVRLNPDGPADSLNCHRLTILFEEKVSARPPPTGKPAAGKPPARKRRGRRPPAPQSSAQPPAAVKPLKPARIVALGHPVHLRAPSVGAEARGERFQYSFETRVVELEDSRHVWLRHEHHEIEAPRLEYELAEESRRMGRLWAAGPGRFHSHPTTEDEPRVHAVWQDELRLQPQDEEHVLSVQRSARVDVEGSGWFAAERIYLWLREQAEKRTPPKSPAAKPRSADTQYQVQPSKMLAEGTVRFDSPQLSGASERVEVWIREPVRQPRTRQPGEPHRERPQPPPMPREEAPAQVIKPPQEDEEAPTKYDLRGELIRLQLLKRKKYEIEHVTVRGGLRLLQLTQTEGEPPLTMNGDLLELRDGLAGDGKISITGRPAHVAAQGMTMSGGQLQLHQQENRLWIDGPGWMTLPPSTTSTPDSRARLDAVRVDWKGRMQFDGQVAHFEREVVARGQQWLEDGTRHEVLVTATGLDVELTQQVNFRRPKNSGSVNAERLTFQGGTDGVLLTDRATDAVGQLESLQRLLAGQLVIRHQSGAVDAQGPGWVESVSLGRDLPLNPNAAPSTITPPSAGELVYVNVSYQDRIQGNIRQREFHFEGRVKAVHGPVQRWDQRLSYGDIERLPEDSVMLDCDRLSIMDMGSGGQSQMEMVALGNTFVEGRGVDGLFTAQAHRLSYVRAKDQLVIEGDGRSDALLSRQARPGAPATRTAARKILFWRREGRIKVDSFQYLDLSDPSLFGRSRD